MLDNLSKLLTVSYAEARVWVVSSIFDEMRGTILQSCACISWCNRHGCDREGQKHDTFRARTMETSFSTATDDPSIIFRTAKTKSKQERFTVSAAATSSMLTAEASEAKVR